ncbi:ATP-binding protein [Vibrio variabilis]|uniref:ATP-binding protein n=1 Tax=Vibrio variabilis TaxID=990271 RepID=UPI0013A6B8B4|nr:ATP-binding protein [Vibrio variabilis]
MTRFLRNFESSIDASREIAAALREFWGQQDIQTPVIHDLELCVVELANNVYEHGYQEKDGKLIEVGCRVAAKQIEVTINHEGLSLDSDVMNEMLSAPLQELDLDDPLSWATSGRGFYILNALMDDVSVSESNGVTSFRLTKHLSSLP